MNENQKDMVKKILALELKSMCWGNNFPTNYQKDNLKEKLINARNYIQKIITEAKDYEEIKLAFKIKIGRNVNAKEKYILERFKKDCKDDLISSVDLLVLSIENYEQMYKEVEKIVTDLIKVDIQKNKEYEQNQKELKEMYAKGYIDPGDMYGDTLREALGGD